MSDANRVVVLDFETTGLSPQQGDRAIEIGAVKLENGQIVDQFQALMNPGRRVSGFIEQYTGISNQMLATAPPCAEVMAEFVDFVGDYNLVAHNASFDRKFLDAELSRIGLDYPGQFACSLLLSRRLLQQAPNHKLGTLVAHLQLPTDGTFHRALADASMTAHLWLKLVAEVKQRSALSEPGFDQLVYLSSVPKTRIDTSLARLA